MRTRKAQITLFFVIGIVLVFSVFFIIYLNVNTDRNIERASIISQFYVPPEMAPIKSFVDDCLTLISRQGLALYGAQNGLDAKDSIDIKDYKVQYAVFGRIPTIKQIESELAYYVSNNLPTCIDGFTGFPGKDIKTGKIQTKTSINKEDVAFVVKFPVTLTLNDKELVLDTYTVAHPLRLSTIRQIMAKTAQVYSEQNQYELYEHLGTLDMNASVYGLGKDLVVVLEDRKFGFGDSPYTYVFGLKG